MIVTSVNEPSNVVFLIFVGISGISVYSFPKYNCPIFTSQDPGIVVIFLLIYHVCFYCVLIPHVMCLQG